MIPAPFKGEAGAESGFDGSISPNKKSMSEKSQVVVAKP